MQTLGGNKGPAIKTLFMCRGEPTMPRSFTIIATALLSFGIVSCSTSDDAAGQSSPSTVPLTAFPTSERAQQPTKPPAEQSSPSDSAAPEASPEPPPEASPEPPPDDCGISPSSSAITDAIATLAHPVPHTLLDLIKPTAATTPAPI